MNRIKVLKKESVTVNTNTKTFVVPKNEIWRIDTLYVNYTTNGNAGTRNLGYKILRKDNTIVSEDIADATQIATLVRRYNFNVGGKNALAFVDGLLHQRLDFYQLHPAYQLVVFDTKNISGTAGENLLVYLTGTIEYTVSKDA